MIEPITSQNEATIEKEWFLKEYQKSIIDLNQKPLKPDGIIGIGKSVYQGATYHNWIMSKGELSVISAPSKSFKSTLKSHLASTYFKGYSNEFKEWKGNQQNNETLIDVDTEQGKYYAWHTFNRTKQLCTGINLNKIYYPFKLRHLNPTERVNFIDELIKSNKVGKPALMFIDGIADLIEDTNDLLMSNDVISKVMKWTDEYNIHVNLIIHNAYGTKKPTGHMGSATVKKAETVININEVTNSEGEGENYYKVTHQYSRGARFQDFYFEFDQQTGFLKEVDKVGQDETDGIDF